MQEQERTVNVKDHAIPLFTVHFANSISMSNLCTIPIRSYRIPTRCDLVCYLSRQDSANRTILIQNPQGLSINLNNTSNGSGAIEQLGKRTSNKYRAG